MMLSNITVPLLGLVDTAVIGHLPDSRHLAAVAVGSMLFTIIYWAFGFLRMGTTGLVAQACGRNDGEANRRFLAQSLLLGISIGGLLWCLQIPLISTGLYLVQAAPEVTAEAQAYAAIRIYGAPAILCHYALIGWFIGNQNTRTPLLLVISANLVNMLLDLVAVYGLDMRADGIAAATVISEYFSLALGLYLVRRQLRHIPGELPRQRLLQWSDYLHLIRVNRYLFVRTLLLLGSIGFFTAQGAQQGTDILSANAVLLNFLLLIANWLDGFAHATEALSGKALGAGQLNEFYQTVTAALFWSLFTALGLTLVFWLAGGLIIDLLTDIDSIRVQARHYLPWIIALPLLGVWSFLLDGIFVGTTRFRAMQYGMIFSVFIVFLPMWWITQPMDNHGLWLAFSSLFVARALSSGYVYWRISQTRGWIQ
ncbi:MATE family efflux transporter [Pontibacter sp. JAM-7]|uniref:MATE family efflux transporter n=1 Tax=Pontibacter sp. JAM-7 TaxID=3366581 RepID=UPI003AF8323A